MKCPFEIGHVVRHKASGERAVVITTRHWEKTKLISVSTGFEAADIDVYWYMIEALSSPRESMEYHKNAIMAELAKLEVLGDISTRSS